MDYLGVFVGAVPSSWCWQKCLAQNSVTQLLILRWAVHLGVGALEGGLEGGAPKPHPLPQKPGPRVQQVCHPLLRPARPAQGELIALEGPQTSGQ